MNLNEYVRILLRRGWIIVVLAVIVGGTAYFLSREQTPVYRSTQLALIQPSRTDLGLTEASRTLLNPLVVYLDTQEIAGRIIEDLHLDMDPGTLKSNVTIAADQLRMVIRIDVDHGDGEVANQIARAWGQELVDYRNEQNATVKREDRVNALLPDQPRYGQQAPRPKIMGAAGAILGALLGIIIAFILEFLESGIIRGQMDLERAEVPVLVTIPQTDH